MYSNPHPDIDLLVDSCAREAAAHRLGGSLSRRAVRRTRGIHLTLMTVVVIVLSTTSVVNIFPPDDGYTMTVNHATVDRQHVVALTQSTLSQQ